MEFFNSKMYFSCILLICVCLARSSYSLELAPDGGYTLRVGVDDNISEKSAGNLLTYVNNLKGVLDQFSRQLFSATKGRFHIKNVELLVPSGWSLNDGWNNTEYVSNDRNTYAASDIKVSRSAKYPYVERTQVCGQAGKYLELPLSFFATGNTNGAYGTPSKALTALFAQLRFGVFEENGYESNARYPYFYKQSQSASWEATGCSSEELKGEFLNAAGARCDPADETTSCRFIPGADNTAKSSLMHFHWLNSVTEFCDETTHNPLSPNRQNALCGYRSVMEVIQSTADYTRVTSPPTTAPAVNIQVLEQAPLLYMLLDRGSIHSNAIPTLTKILPKIFQLFGVSSANNYDAVPPYTVAAIGKYPHTAEVEVEDVVPWSTVSDNEEAFMDAIEFNVGGPETKKYTNALKEVAEKIKAKNHGAGGVIILLRTGGQPHSYEHINYEEELLATLKQEKIILNTIELRNPEATPENPSTANLVNLARESGGAYAVIDVIDEVDLIIQNTLYHVTDSVHTYTKDTNYNYDLLYEGTVTKGANPLPLKINARNGIHTLRLSFTTLSELTELKLGDAGLTDFQKTNDWMAEDSAIGKRTIYSIRLYDIKNPSDLDFSFSCSDETAENCQGFLVSYALYTEENYSNEVLDVKISTSAVEDKINFATTKEPLAIFAKVSKGGLPVSRLTVAATVTDQATKATTVVPLSDNGELLDISADDGVYSGYFLNPADGSIDVKVSVNNPTTPTNFRKSLAKASPALGRILPVDQSFPVGGPLTGPMKERVLDLLNPIQISNVASFKAYPDAVRTLTVDIKPSIATLSFTSPKIIGGAAEARISSYVVRRSESRKALVDNFNNAELVRQELTPGVNPEISVNDESLDSEKRFYYAVKTTYGTAESDLSNLVAVGTPAVVTTTTPGGGGGASSLTFSIATLTITICLWVFRI